MKRSFMALSLAALILAGCGDSNTDPAATIEAYVTAYNAGDIDGVMALFSEESVVAGHPTDTRSESTGLVQIRALNVQDIAAAATENGYTISNVEVTGNTVTWDHVWTRNDGDKFCKFGQSALVQDGVILSWTWPNGGFDCP